MAGSGRLNAFRAVLLDIAGHITKEKLTEMKFLCGDKLPAATLENVVRAENLFRELESKGLLSEHKTEFLESLLEQTGNVRLLQKLDTFKRT